MITWAQTKRKVRALWHVIFYDYVVIKVTYEYEDRTGVMDVTSNMPVHEQPEMFDVLSKTYWEEKEASNLKIKK